MLEKGARKIFCNALVTKLNLSSDFPEFRYVVSGLSAPTIILQLFQNIYIGDQPFT
jgi:hypothetical protein